MNKIYKNSLYMLVAGALVASCADYNSPDNFTAEPDPTFIEPYKDLAPVKSYIDRNLYPNMTIGATLDVKEFNKQELAHAASIANFDNIAFGKTLMSGSIINEKGVMNFMAMMDLLEHVEEIGAEVYGSPIAANTTQPDEWLKYLTAPVEIPVEYHEGKTVDFNTYAVGAYDGTNLNEKQLAKIVKYDNQNTLSIPSQGKTYIVEGFELKEGATYTSTFWAKADKDASFLVNFSGNDIKGNATADGKWKISAGKWQKVVVEAKAAEGVTEGYLQIEMVRGSTMNIQKVQVGYYPDNHEPQTEEQIADTIQYALNTWCDGLMKINKGRIKSFDLIEEAIDNTTTLENGKYALKHNTANDKVYWQDILTPEEYAPVIAKTAREAYERYGNDPSELKFYISEVGLEDEKKMESLNYWIGIWDEKGAKIDGINAKVNLVFYEDEAKLKNMKDTYEKLLDNLATTGKLIRISNFDIKYYDESNLAVPASKITTEQRQKLADFYAYAIKAYMSKIDEKKQAGICKSSLVDTNDPVGLWSKHPKTSDWVRTATYKAWCDALSGK